MRKSVYIVLAITASYLLACGGSKDQESSVTTNSLANPPTEIYHLDAKISFVLDAQVVESCVKVGVRMGCFIFATDQEGVNHMFLRDKDYHFIASYFKKPFTFMLINEDDYVQLAAAIPLHHRFIEDVLEDSYEEGVKDVFEVVEKIVDKVIPDVVKETIAPDKIGLDPHEAAGITAGEYARIMEERRQRCGGHPCP